MKTERIYMNASEVPHYCKGMIVESNQSLFDDGVLSKVIHTSVSDSCITVRPLHWWERLLHWLRRCL
jgi:hypothetical protein